MAVWTVHAHDSLSLPANSVTWSSIPTTYDHLYLTMSVRNDQAGEMGADVELRLGNGSIDTGANYGFTYCYSSGTWPAQFSSTGDSFQYMYCNRTGGADSIWSNIGIWIPFYQSGNWKSIIADVAVPEQSTTNSEFAAQVYAGTWKSTAVVDTVSVLVMTVSADFVADSEFTLYGITGAA